MDPIYKIRCLRYLNNSELEGTCKLCAKIIIGWIKLFGSEFSKGSAPISTAPLTATKRKRDAEDLRQSAILLENSLSDEEKANKLAELFKRDGIKLTLFPLGTEHKIEINWRTGVAGYCPVNHDIPGLDPASCALVVALYRAIAAVIVNGLVYLEIPEHPTGKEQMDTEIWRAITYFEPIAQAIANLHSMPIREELTRFLG